MVEEVAVPSSQEGSCRYDDLPDINSPGGFKRLSMREKTLAKEKFSVPTDCQTLATEGRKAGIEHKENCSVLATQNSEEKRLADEMVGTLTKVWCSQSEHVKHRMGEQGEEVKDFQEKSEEKIEHAKRDLDDAANRLVQSLNQCIDDDIEAINRFKGTVYQSTAKTIRHNYPLIGSNVVPTAWKRYNAFIQGFDATINNKKEIEATLLLFLQKHGVIYFKLLERILPGGFLKKGGISYAFKSLEARGIITNFAKGWENPSVLLKERKSIVSRTSRFVEQRYHKEHEIRWFTLTPDAKELLPLYSDDFKTFVPGDVLGKIRDRSFKSVYGSAATREPEAVLKMQGQEVDKIIRTVSFEKHIPPRDVLDMIIERARSTHQTQYEAAKEILRGV